MEIDFWAKRWSEGKIGFHEGRTNAVLERHAARLEGRRRVLVPLCGKTEDMVFLAARGLDVVGVEAIESAARQFFAEHGLTPEQRGKSLAASVSGRTVEIVVGDFFACAPADVGACDALYDRAALIALPPDARTRYAAHLRSLLAADASGLVISLEYDQARIDGPPFSVVEDEVRRHWSDAAVELLETGPADVPRLKSEGIEGVQKGYAVRQARA